MHAFVALEWERSQILVFSKMVFFRLVLVMRTIFWSPPARGATSLLVSLLGVVLSYSGCADMNDPYGSPYGSPYYGDPYYGDSYRYDRNRRERERIRDEREDLEEERDRLEREKRAIARERQERERREQKYRPPPPPPREERCPSGFTPSERKCTKEERRRGCQDMRLPGGLGCVKR